MNHSQPWNLEINQVQIMNKFCFILVILFFIAGCGSNPKSTKVSECENYSSESGKLDCYVAELRMNIQLQLEQDLRTWFELNGPYGDWWFGELLVKINLKPSGEIEKITVVESSNNLRFDDFIMQTIRNASRSICQRKKLPLKN